MEQPLVPRSLFSSIIIIYLITATIVATLTYRAFFHPLRKIPGPRIAAITGLWRTYHYFRGNWHNDILHLHSKYGPGVRIAPNEVSIVDAVAVKRLYGHGRSARKTSWYSTWGVPGRRLSMFAEQDPKVHAALRKRISSVYAMSSILKYEPYIQSCLDLCFEKIRKIAATSKVVDMSEWTSALSFDVVGELAFGEKLGHLDAEAVDVGNLRHSLSKSFYMSANLGYMWGQSNTINNNPIAALLMGLFGAKPPILDLLNWTLKRVNARKQGNDKTDRDDMLAHFLKMSSMYGDQPATDEDVLAESMNIVGAGADTTSIAMRSCLYFIGLNKASYKRLQAEIDEFYDSQDLKGPITFHQTQGLPYLKAVVSEALRLFPSISYQLPRYSPPGGLNVAEHYIPEGYEIGTSACAQNRDKNVYGEDADEFRPERWLDSKEQSSVFERNNMTFGGSGPRTCIGKNIALVEIQKFVAQFIRQFDVEFADQEKPWDVRSYWFAYQRNMKMHIRVRDKAISVSG